MVDDVVIGIPAAGFGILSVLFTAGIRASVEHHIAAGLILDCRSGVGHVVHRAAAGDGQSALVGNRVVLVVGQGLSVQIEGQLRSLGDYDILRRILEQSNRLALPGVVDRLLEAGVVLAAHLGHTVRFIQFFYGKRTIWAFGYHCSLCGIGRKRFLCQASVCKGAASDLHMNLFFIGNVNLPGEVAAIDIDIRRCSRIAI